MRIFHTADWHLGAKVPQVFSPEKVLNEIYQKAATEKADIILVAGDIFDSYNPNPKIKDLFLRFLKTQEITTLIIPGNHDFSDKNNTYHALKTVDIYGYDNVHLIELGGSFTYGDVSFLSLENLKLTDEQEKEKGKNYIVGIYHAPVPGLDLTKLEPNEEMNNRISTFMEENNLDYLALGDIHKTMKVANNAYYPGPPYQKKYGEEDGYIILDTEENTVSIGKLDLPKRVTLSLEYTTGKKLVKEVKSLVEPGSLVRVLFSEPMEVWTGVKKNKIIEELKKTYNEIKLENRPPLTISDRGEFETKVSSFSEEIEVVIADMKLSKKDKEKVKKLCLEFIND